MRASFAAYFRRARWTAPVAAAAFGIDQIAKLIAAWVHPSSFVLNDRTPSGWGTIAALLTVALVLALPYRPAAFAAAVWAGGAAGNVFDAYAWPGGVPDFIDVGWIWGTFNLADAFVALGALGLGASLLLWVWLGVFSPDPRPQIAE